jgi:hypothetical protein
VTRSALAVLLALASALPAGAKDLRVAADGSGDFKTLLEALKVAAPGDVVVIKKPGGMVGLVLKKEKGAFSVQSAVTGSPAEAAGIKAGETVVAVDGSNIEPLSLEQAVGLIRGPVGSSVVLKVATADGSSPRDVSITRGATRLPIKNEIDKLAIARAESDDAAFFEIASSLSENGVLAAESNLAYLYHFGRGTAKNPKQAARWAQAAAKGGDAAAERLLGVLYGTGAGVERSPELSATWSRAAADKGDPLAMGNLASNYEQGFGVPKDLVQALDWARRAAAPSPENNPENIARSQAVVARLTRIPDGAGVSALGAVGTGAPPADAAPAAKPWWETPGDGAASGAAGLPSNWTGGK